MNYQKVYVSVTAEFLVSGGMRPKTILWKDGRKFQIDKIKFIERAPCKSGGVLPVRYTVIIGGEQKYLYFERDKEQFFIEREEI